MMEQESGSLYNDYGLYRTVTGTEASSTRKREISPDCIRRNPDISLFNTSSYGVAGDIKEFNFYVTNKDNFACPDSSFDLSNNCPSGWTCSFDQDPVSLPPYESAKVKFTITSSASATVGDYMASIIAINTSSNQANSAQIDYSVMPLYAWWGNGSHGNATISSNTNIGGTVKYYNNLTINPGVKLYSSGGPLTIFVKGTLTLNGDIVLEPSIVGGAGGDNSGGDGGTAPRTLTIFARNIVGSGFIKADGEKGDNGKDEARYQTYYAGSDGTASVCGAVTGIAANGGAGIGAGGSAVSGTSISSVISSYINSISPDSLPSLLDCHGASGAGGGSGREKDNDCKPKQKGGGGGGGGAFNNTGGGGGAGVKGYECGADGGGGAGGGGSGGLIVLVSQDISNSITVQAMGGNGGNGHS